MSKEKDCINEIIEIMKKYNACLYTSCDGVKSRWGGINGEHIIIHFNNEDETVPHSRVRFGEIEGHKDCEKQDYDINSEWHNRVIQGA